MSLIENLGALATAVAADMKRVEAGLIKVSGNIDAVATSLQGSLQTQQSQVSALQQLTDEVHSIIDDAAQSSNANTWSIDQIKAYVDGRLKELSDTLASAASSTQADLAATYAAAKSAS